MPPPTQHLELHGLTLAYGRGVAAVQALDLAVAQGELVSLLGPSGCGKTTTMRAVAGLLAPQAGRIVLAGQDITRVPAHRMVFEGLAFVPQTENVFANLTIAENLELAASLLKARGAQRAQRLEPVYAMFPDLARQRTLDAGRLSGGQRQMLAVARALIAQPRLLILDEPSAGLSPKLVGEVFNKLREVRASGVTVLLVEQNVKAALALADRAAVLVEGRERVVAPCAELLADERMAALYLGRHAGDAPAAVPTREAC